MGRRLLVLLSLLVATACSDADAAGGVEVTGEFGRQPTVKIPADDPASRLAIETLNEGAGRPVADGDLVVADYVGYRWGGGQDRLIASSYHKGLPAAFPFGRLVPGLNRALAGKKVGSRVVAVIPPAAGYGRKGNPRLQVTGDDSLVFVLDLLASYPKQATVRGQTKPVGEPGLPEVGSVPPGRAPAVRIPKAAPPRELQVTTIIQGTGPAVRAGRLLIAHYQGMIWRTGRTFESSWVNGQPSAFTIGRGQVVKGWDQGVVGQRAGGRVMLVVPPAWGYGPKGLKQAGVSGRDTLVFVVDILGVH